MTRISRISRLSSASVAGRSTFHLPGGVLMNRDREYQKELQRQLEALPKPRNEIAIDLSGLVQAAKERIKENEALNPELLQEKEAGVDDGRVAALQMVMDKEEKIKRQLRELEQQKALNQRIRSQVFHRRSHLPVPKSTSHVIRSKEDLSEAE